MKTFLTTTILFLSSCLLFASGRLNVWIEYTVGPDGSREYIHVVKIEVPSTHQDAEGALTPKEEEAGVRLVAQQKAPSPSDWGKKVHEILLFDTASRQYVAPLRPKGAIERPHHFESAQAR